LDPDLKVTDLAFEAVAFGHDVKNFVEPGIDPLRVGLPCGSPREINRREIFVEFSGGHEDARTIPAQVVGYFFDSPIIVVVGLLQGKKHRVMGYGRGVT